MKCAIMTARTWPITTAAACVSQIVRALSAELGAALPYDSLAALRRKIVADIPVMAMFDQVPENDWQPVEAGGDGSGDFGQAVDAHFLTNPILRASPLISAFRCSRSRVKTVACLELAA